MTLSLSYGQWRGWDSNGTFIPMIFLQNPSDQAKHENKNRHNSGIWGKYLASAPQNCQDHSLRSCHHQEEPKEI